MEEYGILVMTHNWWGRLFGVCALIRTNTVHTEMSYFGGSILPLPLIAFEKKGWLFGGLCVYSHKYGTYQDVLFLLQHPASPSHCL